MQWQYFKALFGQDMRRKQQKLAATELKLGNCDFSAQVADPVNKERNNQMALIS